MSIKDADGLDRFKCGFLVDNFKDSSVQSKRDPDFNASIDVNNGVCRPSHYTTAVDLLLGTNAIIGVGQTADPSQDFAFANDLIGSGCRRTGDLITLDYTELAAIQNSYASRTENVQPFAVVFWNGNMELNPSSDVWVDTRRTDARNVNIEGNFEDVIEENGADPNTGLISTVWNSWQTDWVGVDVQGEVTTEVETRWINNPPRRLVQLRVPGNRTVRRNRTVQSRVQDILVRVENTTTTTTTEQSRT